MNAALIRGMGTHVKSDGETVTIEGSIHKFANNGLHNYDDFPRSRLVTTVEEMADLWGFDPRQARVHCLEFGANFRVEGTASAFVQNLVSHGTSPLAPMGKRAFQGVEDDTFDRIFKVYDKGTQFGVAADLLRAETHVKQMRFLRRVAPLLTLQDLTRRPTLARLATIAEQQFCGLLAVPLAMSNGLSVPEQNAWEAASNPRTWRELPAEKARRRRDYLREILARYDADPMPAARAAYAAKLKELRDG